MVPFSVLIRRMIMKIKDITDELRKYDENTEVFVNDDEGHERIGIRLTS